jgi:hypothetical protein
VAQDNTDCLKKTDTEILRIEGIPKKERITNKNSGSRIQDREDEVFNLCGVKL